MSTKLLGLFSSFQARLSRQIVFWVFASIVVIEAVILIPSYYRLKHQLILQQEKISETLVDSTVKIQKLTPEFQDQKFEKRFQILQSHGEILGIAVYNIHGKIIAVFGEVPDLSFSDLKNQAMVRAFSADGSRYDMAWSPQKLGVDYALIIRHNTTDIQKELYAFTLRIAGLVLIISGFVTFVTMLVLGSIVIVPILRLRNDLITAGEALSQDRTNCEFYSLSVQRHDELGQVMVAFKQMFYRVRDEILQRKQAEEMIRIEQEKSERLLLNILPQQIAERLKQGNHQIADRFAEVTILFADIVGFTKLSERTSPEALVSLLNEIFSAFDQLTEKYGLEKIKTIGDNYMVAGGLPILRPDHAAAIADMALEMQQEIFKIKTQYDYAISIRIGINTGPVVAGVIGQKKFIYDLWGDAVNMASRMESHGIADAIQVTPATYQQLQSDYVFKERGQICIKGKGKMITYLLLGKKNKREDNY